MSGKHVIEDLPEVYILTSNLKIVTASFKIVCFEDFTKFPEIMFCQKNIL